MFAHEPTPAPGGTPGADGALTTDQAHQAMHAMMDAMHGEGTSERMHEAMGPDGEHLMEQCAAMMAMMGGDMPGMMGGECMQGMEGMPMATPTPGQ